MVKQEEILGLTRLLVKEQCATHSHHCLPVETSIGPVPCGSSMSLFRVVRWIRTCGIVRSPFTAVVVLVVVVAISLASMNSRSLSLRLLKA